MKYLLLLFFVGCSSHGYKHHNKAVVRYTVREYYLPSEVVKTVKTVPSKSKPRKAVKKTYKVNCERVLREINQCVR